MRILVFGAGVIGCNLASALFSQGKDVTLLARGEWGKTIEREGLVIRNRLTMRKKRVRIPVVEELGRDDLYDVIFVTVRFTNIGAVIPVLCNNGTENIVFVGNNTRAAYFSSLLPGKNVLFAFSSSAGHREKDCVVSIDLRKITIGGLSSSPSDEALAGEIFRGTKYRVNYESNMESYLLSHAAFVVPAAFAVYYTDGDLRKIGKDRDFLSRILNASIEGYSALEKAGFTILPDDEDYRSGRYRKICMRLYSLLCRTALGRICVSDHALNAVEEMRALDEDLKAIFTSAGAEMSEWQELERMAEKYLRGDEVKS